MFRNKHVYTCPDVIHDRQVAKKNALITLAVWGAFYGGLYAYGRRLVKREEAALEEEPDTTPSK